MARTTTRFRTTEATIQKVTGIVREALEERFADEFVFDPIIVNPRIDHYGDEYLHMYIVLDGDIRNLDTAWTLRLRGIILDETEEDEVLRVPSISFVGKEEWDASFEATIRKATGIVKEALEERFEDEFVFDLITVEPRFDYDGDQYLHMYIVLDGDMQKLDTAWTIRLRRIILDETEEDGVLRVPSISFVGKEEWGHGTPGREEARREAELEYRKVV